MCLLSWLLVVVGRGGHSEEERKDKFNKDGMKTGEMVDRAWGHRKGQSGGKGNEFCLQLLPSRAKYYTMSPDSRGREDPFQKVGHLQTGTRYKSLLKSFKGRRQPCGILSGLIRGEMHYGCCVLNKCMA